MVTARRGFGSTTAIRRIASVFDYLAMAVAAVAAIYMATHRPVSGIHGMLPGGRRFAAVGLAAGAAAILGLWAVRRARPALQVAGRLTLYVLVGTLALAADGAHEYAKLRAFPVFPPLPQNSYAGRLDKLTSAGRAKWGGLIAAHQLAGPPRSVDLPSVPSDWPFPEDVEIAIRPTGNDGIEVWARARDGVSFCVTIPRAISEADSLRNAAACDENHAVPPGLVFEHPRRTAPTELSAPQGPRQLPWLQYRSDAEKTGANGTAAHLAQGWHRSIDGPVRSSASVAGNLVLIGAHETGAFSALDLQSGVPRWTARLPNWVHQEAVSDGRTVIIGFGSVFGSVFGREPSGVAAYDLETGAHRWTKFDEGSVMTSPVISDSAVLYVTAAGTLRKRSIRSGALLGQLALPGGVIMGPPAISGDTMVIALEVDGVCAVEVSTLKRIWCRTFPGLLMMGHSGPTMTQGTAIVSGTVILPGMSMAEFSGASLAQKWHLIRTLFYPMGEPGGQRFLAINLRDGRTRWASRLIVGSIVPTGHNSGTAAIHDSIGVVVMPNADSVVAFRVATGATLWQSAAHDSRGPPLITNDEVVVAGRDGIIETRDLRSGALKCRLHRNVGYDRAGPTLAGNAVIFANLNGEVEAMPITDLLACNSRPGS
jgi:outer membrane protein assembly factor BamB